MFPTDLFALQVRLATLALEAQSVIALRLMGMSGIIPAHRGENSRMVHEKGTALSKSMVAATRAMAAGHRPDQVMHAALTPLSARVRANRKRLSK